MIETYAELRTVLINKFKFKEITINEFEENYPHYSLEGDKDSTSRYLKGIFVDNSGKVNSNNDPFVIIVFAKDNKVLGERLNGGPDVVPEGLFDTLDEVEHEECEDFELY